MSQFQKNSSRYRSPIIYYLYSFFGPHSYSYVAEETFAKSTVTVARQTNSGVTQSTKNIGKIL